MNVNNIIEEKKLLEKQVGSIDQELKQLPEKDFFCAKNGSGYKWYETDGKNPVYIKKQREVYAEKLAKRKYLLAKRSDLCRELKALDSYLKYHKSEGEAEKLLNNSGYARLLAPYLKPVDHEFQEWMNAPFKRNELHQEGLIHKTNGELMVRSKSEVLIALQLQMRQIPFRYECLLQLGNHKCYPDFTIKHPRTGRIYYYEHFGMMDDEDYRKNAFAKMQLYAQHGIILGINLIATFETQSHPLEVDLVKEIIDYYFT